MKKFISLLRGINVGKSKRISRETLINFYSSLEFKNIKVLGQSGNVIFETSTSSPNSVAEKISRTFQQKFSYDVPVIILSPSELGEIIKNSPFKKEAEEDPSKVLVGYFASKPSLREIQILNAMKSAPNVFFAQESAMYLFCPGGVGNAKLPNFEKVLEVDITFRNSRVAQEILALSQEDK